MLFLSLYRFIDLRNVTHLSKTIEDSDDDESEEEDDDDEEEDEPILESSSLSSAAVNKLKVATFSLLYTIYLLHFM